MSNRGCPVETFLYNWCLGLKDYYDITVLYDTGDIAQLERLYRIVDIEQFDANKEYECDIFVRNAVWGKIPNVTATTGRYLEMRHADYVWLKQLGRLQEQYHVMDKVNEIIACGEYVGKMSHEALGDNPTVIRNILAPKVKVNKVFTFISCTRIDGNKGWERMKKMIYMLREANIKFRWFVYSNTPYISEFEELIIMKPRFDIWDYLADADYCVLLSDREGLPYTVQEALQYGTPCIVTDVGGCTELIKDGVNGYVVPLDMNFDINIIKKIPKVNSYSGTTALDWCNYLGGAEPKHKEEYKGELFAEIIVTKGYTDAKLKEWVNPGKDYILEAERAKNIVREGFGTFVRFVKPEKKRKRGKDVLQV